MIMLILYYTLTALSQNKLYPVHQSIFGQLLVCESNTEIGAAEEENPATHKVPETKAKHRARMSCRVRNSAETNSLVQTNSNQSASNRTQNSSKDHPETRADDETTWDGEEGDQECQKAGRHHETECGDQEFTGKRFILCFAQIKESVD